MMVEVGGGVLYCGDCLDILGKLESGSVDLIYLDPPFNTGRSFESEVGGYVDASDDYVGMIRERIVLMRDVLSISGAIYLHCDPRESHYLKLMMDGVFGRCNFRNELIWCYSPSGRGPVNAFHRKHDVILYYGRSDAGIFNRQYVEMSRASREVYSAKVDVDGRRYGYIRGRRCYLDEHPGRPVPDWWDDVGSFSTFHNIDERTGYPNQKPLALLDRIIRASTNEGDLVLDPYCGSGTTLLSAERLGRRWVGIDKSEDALRLSRRRVDDYCRQGRICYVESLC